MIFWRGHLTKFQSGRKRSRRIYNSSSKIWWVNCSGGLDRRLNSTLSLTDLKWRSLSPATHDHAALRAQKSLHLMVTLHFCLIFYDVDTRSNDVVEFSSKMVTLYLGKLSHNRDFSKYFSGSKFIFKNVSKEFNSVNLTSHSVPCFINLTEATLTSER